MTAHFLRPLSLILLLFLTAASRPVSAKEKKSSTIKVNYLALAAVLVRDGHFTRALNVLAKVKVPKQTKSRIQYHTLYGIIRIKRREYLEATRHLQLSIRAGQTKPLVYLLLTQSHFRLLQYRQALQALKKAPWKIQNMSSALLLHAQSLWRLRRLKQAYQVLQRGQKQYPTQLVFQRLHGLLMIEMGLFQTAWREIQRYLERGNPGTAQYLMFARAYRKQKAYKKAALLLEEALLKKPNHAKLLLQLARVYLEAKKYRTAAVLLERAARHKRSLIVEAAELYRRAGMLWRAFYLNAQVIEQKAKIRQRLGLLIELRRYEEATALAPRLSRLGLLQDQSIVYALAFACYRLGYYQKAERWLNRLTTRSLFKKAIELRRAMRSCQSSQNWWCP